jgi:hypothetical protein
MHVVALQTLPKVPSTALVADTMITTAVLLGLVGLVGLIGVLQRHARGRRAGG